MRAPIAWVLGAFRAGRSPASGVRLVDVAQQNGIVVLIGDEHVEAAVVVEVPNEHGAGVPGQIGSGFRGSGECPAALVVEQHVALVPGNALAVQGRPESHIDGFSPFPTGRQEVIEVVPFPAKNPFATYRSRKPSLS